MCLPCFVRGTASCAVFDRDNAGNGAIDVALDEVAMCKAHRLHLGGIVVKRPPLNRAISVGRRFDSRARRSVRSFPCIFSARFSKVFSRFFQGAED